MTKAAARITDPHTCPMVDEVSPAQKRKIRSDIPAVMKPHVGGPLTTEGSLNVNINGLRAARCGDLGKCEGTPATDMIVTGAAKVFINGRLAAVVGSITEHKGAVTGPGSPNVLMGDAMDGATFGNGKAGTDACLEAAKSRENYQKTGGKDQTQGKNMNCGHESVRQLCIQKCQQSKDPSSEACKQCQQSEDQWYRKYLADEKGTHNDIQKAETEKTTKENDERWQKVLAAPLATQKSIEGTRNDLVRYRPINKGGGWPPYQKASINLHSNDTAAHSSIVETIFIQALPTTVTDDPDKDAKAGNVESFTKTRKDMLGWCGIESEEGENTPDGIAKDLGKTGKPILAQVDVGKLNGRGEEGAHSVTITQMSYNDKGELVEVVMNDTAGEPPGNCCGRTFTGPGINTFKKALLTKRQTNVTK